MPVSWSSWRISSLADTIALLIADTSSLLSAAAADTRSSLSLCALRLRPCHCCVIICTFVLVLVKQVNRVPKRMPLLRVALVDMPRLCTFVLVKQVKQVPKRMPLLRVALVELPRLRVDSQRLLAPAASVFVLLYQ